MARQRSPSYPAISIGEAIDRAHTLYDAERQSPAPWQTVVEHWGYKANGSAGQTTIAALKKYGLIAYEGSGNNRKARLTDLAVKRILLDKREPSPERDAAVLEAALTPTIHRELWEQTHQGSSPQSIEHFLTVDRNFSESAAATLIKQFDETISYAKLVDNDTVPPDEEAHLEEDSKLADEKNGGTAVKERPDSQSPAHRPYRTYRLPLFTDDEAILQVPGAMSDADWTQMMAVLDAMKPGILRRTAEGAND